MAELVDAGDLKSPGAYPCRFDSGWRHQKSPVSVTDAGLFAACRGVSCSRQEIRGLKDRRVLRQSVGNYLLVICYPAILSHKIFQIFPVRYA